MLSDRTERSIFVTIITYYFRTFGVHHIRVKFFDPISHKISTKQIQLEKQRNKQRLQWNKNQSSIHKPSLLFTTIYEIQLIKSVHIYKEKLETKKQEENKCWLCWWQCHNEYGNKFSLHLLLGQTYSC